MNRLLLIPLFMVGGIGGGRGQLRWVVVGGSRGRWWYYICSA